MLKKLLSLLAISFYFVLLAGVSGKLFFEKQFDALTAPLLSLFSRSASADTLTIGFSEPLAEISPLANDTGSRARLYHIFEGLVRATPDLAIEPALAVSYGALDDLTWEFRLRPNVFFHNGTKLGVDDVIYSLLQAKNDPRSRVKDFASTITSVAKVDEQIIHITTDAPDPLLLAKLASLFIFPSNSLDANQTVGTGPYMLESNDAGTMKLSRFDRYWGAQPAFKNVVLTTFAAKQDKLFALNAKTVDIVANVPVDVAADFGFSGFEIVREPSLEVNFLMFHFDKTFRERALREAVANALDVDELARLGNGFAVPATQFVRNGIFGYDPTIPKRAPDLNRAQELVKSVSPLSRVQVTLDLPQGLDVFGAVVKEQLKKTGIDVTLAFSSSDELGRKIVGRESEWYFFGWRSELGDAADFLTAAVHSRTGSYGAFNGGNYRSTAIDNLIELSQETIKPSVRLERLREVMRKITMDDIIGIPIFSPEVLYGVSSKLTWKPRVDGYILAQEVKL